MPTNKENVISAALQINLSEQFERSENYDDYEISVTRKDISGKKYFRICFSNPGNSEETYFFLTRDQWQKAQNLISEFIDLVFYE